MGDVSRRQPRGIALLAFALVCSLVTFAPLPAAAQEEPPEEVTLTGAVRDFQGSHPDFQYRIGTDKGIVTDTIGADRKPVYAYPPGESSPTTNGVETFDQWYRDVEGVNLTAEAGLVIAVLFAPLACLIDGLCSNSQPPSSDHDDQAQLEQALSRHLQQDPQLDPDTLRQALRRCLNLADRAPNFDAQDCTDGNLPILVFTERSRGGKSMEVTASNIADTVAALPGLTLLTKGHTPGLRHGWFDEPANADYKNSADKTVGACVGRQLPVCDEYPFFSSTSAGPPLANLRPTSTGEGVAQGGTITGFNTRCRVSDNDDFLVIPLTLNVRTQYLCRNR